MRYLVFDPTACRNCNTDVVASSSMNTLTDLSFGDSPSGFHTSYGKEIFTGTFLQYDLTVNHHVCNWVPSTVMPTSPLTLTFLVLLGSAPKSSATSLPLPFVSHGHLSPKRLSLRLLRSYRHSVHNIALPTASLALHRVDFPPSLG